jgi:cellulose synthase/poly-beta-1,6-N-acetylglucosamine synthase-like glycosyltransferase
MALLGGFAHGLLLAVLVLHCALGASITWIVVQHLRYRRSALREESLLLNSPLPADADLPHVLVQIPTYNEGNLVLRSAVAVASLDWPRDKLHVQILDDSTDESVTFAQEAVQRVAAAGVDAKLLHREHRSGFKAGALGEGLRASDQPFVAIFDADYVPPAHFLRACIRPMLADPRVALVQARCDYLNGDENLLTRAQQRILDAHFGVEQPTRAWTGQVLPFNGTCGVWRRAAIDEAGGWRSDTLAEDLDLSYRVQLRGWRGRFLVTVAAPGVLPDTFEAWRSQQFRWEKGFTEVGRKLWPSLWRSDLSLGKKLVSQAHLSETVAMPINVAEILLCAVDFTVGSGVTAIVVAGLLLAQLQGKLGRAIMLLLGQQAVRGASLWRELLCLPMVACVELFNLILTLRGVADALIGRSTEFVRTPKKVVG